MTEKELDEFKKEVELRRKERELTQFKLFDLNKKPTSSKTLCWRVFIRDMNDDKTYAENVFNLNYYVNGKIYETTIKCQNFKEWEKQLLSNLHDFWSRCQYEICIGEWTTVDVYTQLTMNWEHFTDYLWNNRDLIKKELKKPYEEYKANMKYRQEEWKKYLKAKKEGNIQR